MAKVPVYNKEGKATGDIEVNDAVFGVEPNVSLVHQVYVTLEANARQPWAHVKTRGDVRGGGRKPWRQKGTGRARHGSIRSPLWTGGGVTFGPRNDRNYKQRLNSKMRKAAVKMVLSDKLAEQRLVALDGYESSGKTKEFVVLRTALPGNGKSTLLLVDGKDEQLNRATRNIPGLNMQRAQDVNVVDLLNHQYVIVTADAVKALESRLA